MFVALMAVKCDRLFIIRDSNGKIGRVVEVIVGVMAKEQNMMQVTVAVVRM